MSTPAVTPNNPAGPVVPDIVANTPRVEAPEPEQRVEFTAAQQAKVNEIVKAAMGRAAFETRTELGRTKKALEAALLAANPDASEIEKARAEAEVLKLRLTDLAEEHSRERLENAITRAANAERFVDPEQCSLLIDKASLVKEDGSVDAAKVNSAVAALAQRSPHLIRGEVKPGAGSAPAQSVPADAPKLEELFGRGSNAKKCNELAIKNPSLYRTLRAQALRRGLVG